MNKHDIIFAYRNTSFLEDNVVFLGKHLKECSHCNTNNNTVLESLREFFTGKRVFDYPKKIYFELGMVINRIKMCEGINEEERILCLSLLNTFALTFIIHPQTKEQEIADMNMAEYLMEKLI